jgi:hypothetical protein
MEGGPRGGRPASQSERSAQPSPQYPLPKMLPCYPIPTQPLRPHDIARAPALAGPPGGGAPGHCQPASGHARQLPSNPPRGLAGRERARRELAGLAWSESGPPAVGGSHAAIYRRGERGDTDRRLRTSLHGSAMPWHPGRPPIDGVPACTQCGRRPARSHDAVGYYRTCTQCARLLRDGSTRWQATRRRRRCPGCHAEVAVPGRWCSNACQRSYARGRQAENKTAVLAALGGRCACPGVACWHTGACAVTAVDILTVHHLRGDGSRIRGARLRGGHAAGESARNWSRYRRALALADPGMELLCANCHALRTAQRRQERLLP